MASLATKIHYYLWAVGPPVFIVLGTAGNMLAILVLRRRPLRSVQFYLTILAVIDTIMLYVGFAHDWLYSITEPRIVIRYLSPVACKIQLFLLVTCKWSSAWILVAITIQRFVSVYLPLKSRLVCSARVPLVSTLVILVVCIIGNSHFFFTYGPALVKTGNITMRHNCKKINETFLTQIWPWIDAACGSFAPFIVLVICNVGLVARLIKRKNSVVAMGGSRRDRRISDNHVVATTAMLLVASFMFLLLTAPYFLWRLLHLNSTPKGSEAKGLSYGIAKFLQYTNYAANFYLYCVCGSSFRTELSNLMHCRDETTLQRNLRASQYGHAAGQHTMTSQDETVARQHIQMSQDETVARQHTITSKDETVAKQHIKMSQDETILGNAP